MPVAMQGQDVQNMEGNGQIVEEDDEGDGDGDGEEMEGDQDDALNQLAAAQQQQFIQEQDLQNFANMDPEQQAAIA